MTTPLSTLRMQEISHSLRWSRIATIAVLLLTDMMALVAAVFLGYLLWGRPVLHQSLLIYVHFIPLLSLFPLGYAGAGLYPGFGLGTVESLRRLTWCTSSVFLLMAAASCVLQLFPYHSRMVLAMAWGASLVTLPLLRFLVIIVVRRWQWWGEPTVLVGSTWGEGQTIEVLANALSLGYRPLGVLCPAPHGDNHAMQDMPVLGGLEIVPQIARRGIRVALIDEGLGRQSATTLSWLQQHFQHVVLIRETKDLPVERAQVCHFGGVLGIAPVNDLLCWQSRFIKRTLDMVLGAICLVLTSPLIALGGLLVHLCSGGPSFFFQEREGLGGKRFMVWKIRTMYRDAEMQLEEFLSTSPERRREWEECVKLAHDPRIIAGVGSFLRRFSIDELPQLWNVVRGEMSLVGPRPLPDYHLQRFPREFRELRQQVRPGLTGMWQVMVRSKGAIKEQRIYDTYYIRNWSLWLDLYILARTILVVLTSRGAL